MSESLKPSGPVSPVAFRWMAGAAGLIGLAGSGIGAWFFAIAIREQVSDPSVQHVLVATAMLFTLTEMLVFGLAGILHGGEHKAMRRKLVAAGCLLVCFEAVSIFGAQIVVNAGDDARMQASQTRIAELRVSIARQREAAAALVESGRVSGQSVIAASRQSGLDAMRRGADIEADVLTLSTELAKLEAAQAPSQASIFGKAGAVVLGLVRAVLLSGVGLGMVSLAGVLWHLSRGQAHPEPDPAPAPETLATAGLQPVAGSVPDPVPGCKPAPVPDRYEQVRAGVMAGTLKPSVRSLQAAFGGSTTTAREHLNRLHDEGLIQDMGPGRGYCLRQSIALQ